MPVAKMSQKKIMVADREEALAVLENAHPDQVRVTHLPDGRTQIEVMPCQETASPSQKRWARVAAELAQENLLGDGLGDKVRASSGAFRDSFAFRGISSETREK